MQQQLADSGDPAIEALIATADLDSIDMDYTAVPTDPVANGTMPVAIAAALPPDEPPGERSRFHGLRLGGKSGFSVTARLPCSGVRWRSRCFWRRPEAAAPRSLKRLQSYLPDRCCAPWNSSL